MRQPSRPAYFQFGVTTISVPRRHANHLARILSSKKFTKLEKSCKSKRTHPYASFSYRPR